MKMNKRDKTLKSRKIYPNQEKVYLVNLGFKMQTKVFLLCIITILLLLQAF